MIGMTLMHLTCLHLVGSNNPLGFNTRDNIKFYPYFVYKDLIGFCLFMLILSYLIFYYPNILGHPDNFIKANPLITPAHIVPEWYFLPFYAILRAVPNKLGGVALMGGAIGIYFILPLLDVKTFFRSPLFRDGFELSFWCFITSFICLGLLGAKPIAFPYDWSALA
jgi:ubiquinol-cytochrome c reductase cytochrome b subunit